MQSAQEKATKHVGSCHCGAVKFEATIDLSSGGSRCNCSLCTKLGTTNGIVKPDAFSLIQGKEKLGEYQCGAKTSRRYFCKECGVHCFGSGFLEEVGGDYVAVNLNCLDNVNLSSLKIGYWDGRNNNWEAGTREVPWPIPTTASA